MINVFTDGGARGNPGPAAIGVCIVDEKNNPLYKKGETIGPATNNIAEYKAVIKAFNWVIDNDDLIRNSTICFFIDSQLIVFQLTGFYRVKNLELKKLFLEIKELEKRVGRNVKYVYIPREKNKEADRLVNLALDNKP